MPFVVIVAGFFWLCLVEFYVHKTTFVAPLLTIELFSVILFGFIPDIYYQIDVVTDNGAYTCNYLPGVFSACQSF